MQQAVVRSKNKRNRKKHEKIRPTRTHHEIHCLETATTSRRRGTKHVPRVGPYSPASIDPELWESLSSRSRNQSRPINITHARRQTNRQTNEIMTPCTHPGTKIEVNEASGPHTCIRPCVFEENKNTKQKKTRKIRPTQKTPRNPQQPGDRGHPETACDETRPTR